MSYILYIPNSVRGDEVLRRNDIYYASQQSLHDQTEPTGRLKYEKQGKIY